jgi:NAD(P)-dependent dehydrogenase (short-subunit alcohol dehydrogenase family)
MTGGGGVLCSAFALALAEQGHRLALIDINNESGRRVAANIVARGGMAKNYVADVIDRAQLEAVHQRVLADFGPCEILINGAGGNSPRCTTSDDTYIAATRDSSVATFFNLDRAGFDFVFNLNMMGTLVPTQVFAADMIGRSGCTIINISSMNAFRPLTRIPAYSAAKAAVSNFTQWLAVHFAGEGIRVNAIAPGFFITGQNRALLIGADGSPTARAQKILRATPLGRFGEPGELIGTLLWLIDEKASGFVTGIIVPVDGGFSAYSGV